MKRLFLNLIIVFAFTQVYAQTSLLNRDERLVGDNYELAAGIHLGAFDCNQTTKYPYNFGAIVHYNYIPDVTQNWFFGTEVGAFLLEMII